METQKKTVQIAEEFKELFNPEWRNIVYYGGRGSLKSHSVARALLLRGRQSKLRILCTRELQKSIKDSVHKLLADLIGDLEFNDYVIQRDSITNRITGTEFIFLGLRLNINEVKSLEGIDICWVEEAQAITDQSIEVLTPTIRKPGSQLIWTFNRIRELDPVYVKFVLNQTKNTYVKKVNYVIALRENWMPDVLIQEMEEDKANPVIFNHKWLGEPISQTDKSIISRDDIIDAMNREIPAEGQEEVGADIARMGGDRTVLWKRKGLKTTDFKAYEKKRVPEICDLLEKFVNFDTQVLIKVDDTGVGGGVTDEMLKRGYTVLPINFGGKPSDPNKYPNWISEAWFYIAQIITTIQLPLDDDLLMELSNRQWEIDSGGRRVVESKKYYKKRGFRSPDMADACILAYYTQRQIEYAGVR